MNNSVIISVIIAVAVIGGLAAYFTSTNVTEVSNKSPIKIAINEWPGYARGAFGSRQPYSDHHPYRSWRHSNVRQCGQSRRD